MIFTRDVEARLSHNESANLMAKARKPKENKPVRDEFREERISMEIVVDALDEAERAMGWYYYLEENLHFPFLTRCVKERAISPLLVGDEIEVVGMAPEEECRHEMFVETPWEHRRTLAIPLSQLKFAHGDKETAQAIEDWKYWVEMGYEF
jgi:hypothetical protein